MSLYFFHIIDGDFRVDDEGTDLPDMKAVRAAAISAAGEILRDAGNKGWSGEEWQMHVTDEANKTVLKLVFSAEQMS